MKKININYINNKIINYSSKIITAEFYAREDLIISGLDIIKNLFLNIDDNLLFCYETIDGQYVKENQLIFSVQGKASSITKGEDEALYTLSLLGSLATNTGKIINDIGNYQTKLLVSSLENSHAKAIIDGGGIVYNWQFDYTILIKSKHFSFFGDLAAFAKEYKLKGGKIAKIALEVSTLEQFKEANIIDANIIILKDMPVDLLEICINLSKNKSILIANGLIDLEQVCNYAKMGLDYILVQDLDLLKRIVHFQVVYFT